MKLSLIILLTISSYFTFFYSSAADKFVTFNKSNDTYSLFELSLTLNILLDKNIDNGINKAVYNLITDFNRITGKSPILTYEKIDFKQPLLIIGSYSSCPIVNQLIEEGKIKKELLLGKREKYIITTVQNPLRGVK